MLLVLRGLLSMRAPACWLLLVLAGCAQPKPAGVEDLGTHEHLAQFKLASIRGTRDGDRLRAQAVFTGTSSTLTMDFAFAIGPTTTLTAGSWRWTREGRFENGSIASRAVTFLGGQSGPPSFGGTFDLLDATATARFRVRLPVTPLQALLPD